MDKKKQKKVAEVMREYKAGKLHSGKNGKIVESHKQAVAIALSKAGLQKEGITDLITDILSEMIEEKKKHNLDPVGEEDHDVDNDGGSDSSDEYLKKRREAISHAISHAMKNHYRKGKKGKKRMNENAGGEVPAVERLQNMVGTGILEPGVVPFDQNAHGYKSSIEPIPGAEKHINTAQSKIEKKQPPSPEQLRDPYFMAIYNHLLGLYDPNRQKQRITESTQINNRLKELYASTTPAQQFFFERHVLRGTKFDDHPTTNQSEMLHKMGNLLAGVHPKNFAPATAPRRSGIERALLGPGLTELDYGPLYNKYKNEGFYDKQRITENNNLPTTLAQQFFFKRHVLDGKDVKALHPLTVKEGQHMFDNLQAGVHPDEFQPLTHDRASGIHRLVGGPSTTENRYRRLYDLYNSHFGEPSVRRR